MIAVITLRRRIPQRVAAAAGSSRLDMCQSTIFARTITPTTITLTSSQRSQISMGALFDGQAGDPQRPGPRA
jgi:hypothetical protein